MMSSRKPPREDSPFAEGVRNLPVVEAPDSVWQEIEAAMARPRPTRVFRLPRLAWLAVPAAFTAAAVLWLIPKTPKAHWEVDRMDGAPSVGSERLSGTGSLAVGEWLVTDGASRARIKVGDIGTVDVEPNTRLKLDVAKPEEHRLTLARGEISAQVSAPPRLFFVDTPSSTAVDLGCAYKMTVDDAGFGLLRVTLGWVSLEWGGREAMVPAGAMCRTRPRIGPGTPYFTDAPEPLEQALEKFDFESGGTAALDKVLAQARVRDTLTLWHLLSRVDPGDRARVFERMQELAPLPEGVSREKVLALDRDALESWRNDLAWKW